MIHRRALLAGGVLLPAGLLADPAQAESFAATVARMKALARSRGIRPATLERAFAGVSANARVVELIRHQPEFTLTWTQYRHRVIPPARVAKGRALYAANRLLLGRITQRYGVSPDVLMGIWGIESDFGSITGSFNVVEALTTLVWAGERPAFFQAQLVDALKILQDGDIPPQRMLGSYAGAMGQPQFMPDSFLSYAVDFDGTGRRDIWGNTPDVLASIANFLAHAGWRAGQGWGGAAILPRGFAPALAGHAHRRSVATWARLGVGPAGHGLPPAAMAAVLLPGGWPGEAFLVTDPGFAAIRRYNPSDFYALAVGILGDQVTP